MKERFRYYIFCLVLIALSGILSCDDTLDDFDPSKNPLTGKIGGEEWTYGSGWVGTQGFSNLLQGLILLNPKDPCSVRLTNAGHIQVRFPAAEQTFDLPFPTQDGHVIFAETNGGRQLTASSGFIQLVSITGREAIGFLSADFDDDNFVEGTFVLEICR